MEVASTPAPGNSLGLDIQNLSIEDDGTIPAPEPSEQPTEIPKDGPTDTAKKAEKKKPYVNTDRHMTGSNPRVKHRSHTSNRMNLQSSGRRNRVTMSLLLAWPESERTTRRSSNVDWFVAHPLSSQSD